MICHAQPRLWYLRIATLLFVLGTARYVARDAFHSDEATLQPIVEVSCVLVGACVSLGAFVVFRPKLVLRTPYLLLLGTLVLAVVFSIRSWDPLLSLTRGCLLVMISVSTVALLHIYGLKPLIRSFINAHVVLILFGIAVGLSFPDDFPLMLHDPGEEGLRARLHLFTIHPIALADNCAICLIASELLGGRWIRACRLILVTCLLLTVGRASIILGLPLYTAAAALSTANVMQGIKRLCTVIGIAAATLLVIISVVALTFGWSGPQETGNAVIHIIDATRDNQTLSGRTTLWTMLISDLSFENLYGYGVGGARYYLRTVNPWFSHSHNSALETIYMSGYAGLAGMIAAGIGGLIACFAHWRHASARVLAVAGFYVIAAGMMNPSWYDTSSLVMLSILCGCSWAASRYPAKVSRVTGEDVPSAYFEFPRFG